MKIHVIACCHNEEMLLPYFLRHYTSFCDLVTIYDGKSTDRSVEIIKSFPNTRVFQEDDGSEINEHVLLKFKNEKYKEERNQWDWQIVCDIDEFLYHPNILSQLAEYQRQGVTIPLTYGFLMWNKTFPVGEQQIYEIIKLGTYHPMASKSLIFNPKAVDINYTVGCHRCQPRGNVRYSTSPDLRIFHYMHPGYDFMVRKSKEDNTRLSAINKQNNWGSHLAVQAIMTEAEYDLLGKGALNVVDEWHSPKDFKHLINL